MGSFGKLSGTMQINTSTAEFVQNSKLTVLVKQSVSDWFRDEVGNRQGDPI